MMYLLICILLEFEKKKKKKIKTVMTHQMDYSSTI